MTEVEHLENAILMMDDRLRALENLRILAENSIFHSTGTVKLVKHVGSAISTLPTPKQSDNGTDAMPADLTIARPCVILKRLE